jgi:hypothetical protein
MLYRFVSKIVFLFVLLGLSNSFLYAMRLYINPPDNIDVTPKYERKNDSSRLTFTYAPPLIPIEFSLNNNQVSVNVSKKLVTPIGVFGWGYEAYKLKSRSDYQSD